MNKPLRFQKVNRVSREELEAMAAPLLETIGKGLADGSIILIDPLADQIIDDELDKEQE